MILETGAYGSNQAGLAEAAWSAVEGGADMLKTSSGKTDQGASPEAARTLLEVIRTADRPLGFKASGGIRTLEEAAVYLELADRALDPDWAQPDTFRIGASRLLDQLLEVLEQENATAAPAP